MDGYGVTFPMFGKIDVNGAADAAAAKADKGDAKRRPLHNPSVVSVHLDDIA